MVGGGVRHLQSDFIYKVDDEVEDAGWDWWTYGRMVGWIGVKARKWLTEVVLRSGIAVTAADGAPVFVVDTESGAKLNWWWWWKRNRPWLLASYSVRNWYPGRRARSEAGVICKYWLTVETVCVCVWECVDWFLFFAQGSSNADWTNNNHREWEWMRIGIGRGCLF